jgi:hypothetical protein
MKKKFTDGDSLHQPRWLHCRRGDFNVTILLHEVFAEERGPLMFHLHDSQLIRHLGKEERELKKAQLFTIYD